MGKKRVDRQEDGCAREVSSNNEASVHLASLIDSATTSPADGLDLALIHSIKQIVRTCDAHVHIAFTSLMQKLKHNHAQVRYLALLVADELFTRSKLFRTLLVGDFETFMVHAVGYRSHCPLPPPANRASLLRAKSMEILEKWNDMFGPHYKPLRLGYEYLKNTLHLQFPNLRQAAARAEQQRKEREERSRALAQRKYKALQEDWPVLSADIHSTLKQLEECFGILSGTNKQEGASIEEDDVGCSNVEELGTSSLRRALLEQAKSQDVTPSETHENKPVFDTLRELFGLVTCQHIPSTQDWMSILMKVDAQDRESHNFLLRCVIDLRNQLLSGRAKCLEMGLSAKYNDADDANVVEEIIWEEEGIADNGFLEPNPVLTGEQVRRVLEAGSQHVPSSNSDSERSHDDPFRAKLLQAAPLVPWGSYLDRWGAEHSVPVNQRGLLLESHWGKVDYDKLLPADKVAELSMRASYYTSTKVEIPPCSAPLKKGGLCPRRDLKICPLHGPIIPRDGFGNPFPTPSKTGSLASPSAAIQSRVDKTLNKSEEEFVKVLAEQAVSNVRRTDAEEASKKLEKRLQAKRDREHNAAVLRSAALARTSQGLGEALGEDLERFDNGSLRPQQRESKRAKASLKAMLQPKPTAKDRLARRLLNERANDATVRLLTLDEDAAYREAFANQW